jgi:hypothetical protein
MVIPTVCKESPSAAILSLSTLTLISGFPVSTDNFTPVSGFYLVLSQQLFKTIALSKLVPVTINAIGASSVPRIPTGTVLLWHQPIFF